MFLEELLIGWERGVYICTPMCTSARVALSNIVYLWYGYRSTGISVLNTEIGFRILSGYNRRVKEY